MSGGLKLFHCIRRFGAALLSLSITAAIGLAAETQVRSWEDYSSRCPCRVWRGVGSAESSLGSLATSVYTREPVGDCAERGWCGGIVAGNLFMREQGPELTILQCHIGHPLYQLLGHEIKYDVRRWHFLGGAKRDFMPILQRAECLHEYQ